jgi:hypothetical protein
MTSSRMATSIYIAARVRVKSFEATLSKRLVIHLFTGYWQVWTLAARLSTL